MKIDFNMTAFFTEIVIEVNIDSHALVRNNTEKSHVPFTHFS